MLPLGKASYPPCASFFFSHLYNGVITRALSSQLCFEAAVRFDTTSPPGAGGGVRWWIPVEHAPCLLPSDMFFHWRQVRWAEARSSWCSQSLLHCAHGVTVSCYLGILKQSCSVTGIPGSGGNPHVKQPYKF